MRLTVECGTQRLAGCGPTSTTAAAAGSAAAPQPAKPEIGGLRDLRAQYRSSGTGNRSGLRRAGVRFRQSAGAIHSSLSRWARRSTAPFYAAISPEIAGRLCGAGTNHRGRRGLRGCPSSATWPPSIATCDRPFADRQWCHRPQMRPPAAPGPPTCECAAFVFGIGTLEVARRHQHLGFQSQRSRQRFELSLAADNPAAPLPTLRRQATLAEALKPASVLPAAARRTVTSLNRPSRRVAETCERKQMRSPPGAKRTWRRRGAQVELYRIDAVKLSGATRRRRCD